MYIREPAVDSLRKDVADTPIYNLNKSNGSELSNQGRTQDFLKVGIQSSVRAKIHVTSLAMRYDKDRRNGVALLSVYCSGGSRGGSRGAMKPPFWQGIT